MLSTTDADHFMRLLTSTNKPPRLPGATSSADSPAETELQGYSPPTPTPSTPLAIIIIQSKPVAVLPDEAADNAAPRITKNVVATRPILRPTRSIIRPKPTILVNKIKKRRYDRD